MKTQLQTSGETDGLYNESYGVYFEPYDTNTSVTFNYLGESNNAECDTDYDNVNLAM